MIRHVLLFRFKEGVDEANRTETVDRLRQLEELCPTIGKWSIGINIADSPSAYDIIEIGDFATPDDLSAYKDHPAHKAFSDFVRPLATWALVDYEEAPELEASCGAPVGCFYPSCGPDCQRGDQSLIQRP